MKKKQLVGIIIAAAVFAVVGIIGVLTAANGLLSSSADDFSSFEPSSDYIGIVNIAGTIGAGSTDYFGVSDGYLQSEVLDQIERMKNSESNKAILLYINSPGGSVYHSDEVYLALMDYKSETGRPIYAYASETMASGAYYIACAADKIYANRNATVGSIGVYIQTVNYSGLFEKLGINGEYIRSSENKAMGNEFDELTEEQRAIYQSVVDECYEQFLSIVCEGRGYSRDELVPIADGRIYTATQGYNNGLIDGTETYDDALEIIKADCGVEKTYDPESSAGSLSNLFSSLLKSVPKNETQFALELAENNESGVPMYCAE